MKRSAKILSREEMLRLFASECEKWPEAEKLLLEQGAPAGRLAFELSAQGDNAFAASFLAKAAKRAAVRDELESLLSASREPLYARLRDPLPKRRKQAARLIGALANPLDADALAEALQSEAQRFVRPSIILALGNIGSSAAIAALESYSVEPPASPGDEKHTKEEREALSSALARFHNHIPAFTGFGEEVHMVLRGAIPSVILYEGAAEGLTMLQKPDGVHMACSDYARLQRVRSWREALIPLGGSALEPRALISLLESAGARARLSRWYDSAEAFPLRLEIRNVAHEKRSAFIKECAPMLDKLGFSNAPGAYAAQLRLEPGAGGALAYLELSAPDRRFAYREGALPASIHPADAAAIVRAAFPDKPARVMDPCCGSGTLLVEYGKYAKARLMGIDISPKAIALAKDNAAGAGLTIQLVRKDLKDFIAGEPFDAVVSNLPFGLRVGTHKQNAELYASLLDSLPRWLKPGGAAALYTADYRLLLSEARKRPRLRVAQEIPLHIGGLHARLVLIRVL